MTKNAVGLQATTNFTLLNPTEECMMYVEFDKFCANRYGKSCIIDHNCGSHNGDAYPAKFATHISSKHKEYIIIAEFS